MIKENFSFDQMPHQVSLMNQKLDNLLQLLSKESAGAADQNELLTIEQASRFLKLKKQTLYGKISRRELNFNKPAGSKRVYFYKKDLIEYINKGKRNTRKEYEAQATDCLTQKSKCNG